MHNLRTRLVNFRVTNEEFEKLKSACDRRGARCLSDFARTVMLASQDVDPQDVGERLAALDRRISGLELSISRLVDSFSEFKPTPTR